jgi:tRNA(fMet)-specific endonuclease VapC
VLLLDTNALSEIVRKRPNEPFLRQLEAHRRTQLAASSVSVFELRHGCRGHPRGEHLWNRIRAEVLRRVKILGFGEREAIRAGDLNADLAARGTPIGLEDLMIGATALELGAGVVTRNVRHLARIPGLRVVSWWE